MADYYYYRRKVESQRRRRKAVIALLIVMALLCAAAGYFWFRSQNDTPPQGSTPETAVSETASPAPATTETAASPESASSYAPQRLLPAVDNASWDTSQPVEQTIDFEYLEDSLEIEACCTVKTVGKTGVEIEALTGVEIALLTIYDMCKAVDKTMEMGGIHLEYKAGGKSGEFYNPGR